MGGAKGGNNGWRTTSVGRQVEAMPGRTTWAGRLVDENGWGTGRDLIGVLGRTPLLLSVTDRARLPAYPVTWESSSCRTTWAGRRGEAMPGRTTWAGRKEDENGWGMGRDLIVVLSDDQWCRACLRRTVVNGESWSCPDDRWVRAGVETWGLIVEDWLIFTFIYKQTVIFACRKSIVMYQNLQCIILRSLRYNDRHQIVTAYSRQLGRISFLNPSGSGREAVRRRALMMPLSCVDCTADVRPGKELLTIRDVSRLGGYDFSDNPLKSVTALFIADFLNSTLKTAQADEALFQYITNSIDGLGKATGTSLANFHIAFMIGMQFFMGIEPDCTTYRRGCLFDMADGVFRTTAPLHGKYLGREESAFAYQLSRMTQRNMGLFKMSRAQRNRAVDVILEFYSIHLGNLRDLQSLEVVRSLF